ncbi:YgjV family protein [Halomonas sp. KO116]|uniref:YgjV family protein n=1 Tax=Halomonas sp. KO116 TaxID=1504981 RepID=UPI001F18B65C|nr:YgjV family protein [Halomonas sp. KO116]
MRVALALRYPGSKVAMVVVLAASGVTSMFTWQSWAGLPAIVAMGMVGMFLLRGIPMRVSLSLTALAWTLIDILPFLNAFWMLPPMAERKGIPTALRRGSESPLSRFGGFLLLAALPRRSLHRLTACPALNTLMAATWSALASKPYSRQANRAWLRRFSADTCPHSGQVRLVLCGGTRIRCAPRQASL